MSQGDDCVTSDEESREVVFLHEMSEGCKEVLHGRSGTWAPRCRAGCPISILCWLDADGADFEFGGLGDGVVAGSGEDVDVGFGEAEAGEDGAAGGSGWWLRL